MIFIQDGVHFQVDNDGTLLTMSNLGQVPTDVVIPKTTPYGDLIHRLGNKFCSGSFSQITIPDTVEEVDFGAFKLCRAREVVWSGSCKTVSEQCFAFSDIKKSLI